MTILPLPQSESILKKNCARTKPRPMVFHFIHKFLRSKIMALSQQLLTLDLEDTGLSNAFIDKLEEALGMIEEHSIAEDTFLAPHQEMLAQQVVDELIEQHELEQDDADRMQAVIKSFRATTKPQERILLGDELTRVVNLHTIHLFAHMHYEETVLQCELWQSFSDDELLEMMTGIYGPMLPKLQQLMSALNPREKKLFAEVTQMLKAGANDGAANA
eukprot:TRINITY_DN13055_c0_g1_i1.p1 TRINITY_DN13055_c0_g1~~TRINITY_DN13055_c0_g1_i1.p1  ORF type:complete len:217 (-),score=39.77 TRINITY_DN13055_c0_g1_i1:11-661(-)